MSSDQSTRPRLLVIDDELGPRETLTYLLQENYDVTAVDRAIRGIEEFRANPFDVVVLDIRMPEMNGIQCLDQLIKLDPHAQIVIMTGYGALATQQATKSLGAFDYVLKPFDPDTITSVVQAAFQRRNLLKEMGNSPGSFDSHPSVNTGKHSSSPPLEELPSEMKSDLISAFLHALKNQIVTVSMCSTKIEKTIRDLEVAACDPQEVSRRHKEVLEQAVTMNKTIQSLTVLDRRIRNALGRHPGVLRAVDLNEVLNSLAIYFGKNEILKIHFPEDSLYVRGDRELIWLLFENLIKNAFDAVHDKGTQGWIKVLVQRDRTEQFAEIVVEDNGAGIPSRHIHRIYEPNFTTKSGGLGIGLYLARRSIVIHRGTIECTSDGLFGTKFRLTLPLTSGN